MPDQEDKKFGRREHDQVALRTQRWFAYVAGAAGIVVMLVTIVFPVLGELGIRTGAFEVECLNNVALKADRISSPWPAWLGISIGFVCMLGSAAMAQVAVGGVGVGILKLFKPGAS